MDELKLKEQELIKELADVQKQIKSPNKYELEVVDIDEDFTTYGANQKDLVSAQFVKKIINTLETTDCTLILNDESIEIKNGK